jgi:hypothetical protein
MDLCTEICKFLKGLSIFCLNHFARQFILPWRGTIFLATPLKLFHCSSQIIPIRRNMFKRGGSGGKFYRVYILKWLNESLICIIHSTTHNYSSTQSLQRLAQSSSLAMCQFWKQTKQHLGDHNFKINNNVETAGKQRLKELNIDFYGLHKCPQGHWRKIF